jgi:hypothetical protein
MHRVMLALFNYQAQARGASHHTSSCYTSESCKNLVEAHRLAGPIRAFLNDCTRNIVRHYMSVVIRTSLSHELLAHMPPLSIC